MKKISILLIFTVLFFTIFGCGKEVLENPLLNTDTKYNKTEQSSIIVESPLLNDDTKSDKTENSSSSIIENNLSNNDNDFNEIDNSSLILSVVHPDFKLTDDFIEPVEKIAVASDDYIPISTLGEFFKIGLNLNANYILMNDIELDGNYTAFKDFSGILNGNGYVIKGANGPLFYNIKSGYIFNLGIEATGRLSTIGAYSPFVYHVASVYSPATFASIAIKIEDTMIRNCYFKGEINIDEAYSSAGLVCFADNSQIISCYNAGDFSGYTIGGIVNSAKDCIIYNCFNSGSLYSAENAGGIVAFGYANGILLNIANCYNSGLISTAGYNPNNYQSNDYRLKEDYYASGIIGAIDDSWYSSDSATSIVEISFCFNVGSVYSKSYYPSGICTITSNSADISISYCYNAGDLNYKHWGWDAYDGGYGITCGEYDKNAKIFECYNIGNGVLGGISSRCKNLFGCYFLDNCETATLDGALFSNNAVTKLTETEMREKSNFKNFDFDFFWQMGKGDYPYPVFKQKNPLTENS